MNKRFYLVLSGVFVLLFGLLWYVYSRGGLAVLIRSMQPSLAPVDIEVPEFENKYTMEFVGSYVIFDDVEEVVTLRSKDEKNYNFQVPTYLINNEDDGVLGFVTGSTLRVRWEDRRSYDELQRDYNNDPSVPLNSGATAVIFERLN